MLRLDECEQVAAAGPKARRLAAARRSGLRVPAGFVVLPDEPLPTAAALQTILAELASGGRFAVRSSAKVEDLAGRSAAGLFETCTDVAPADVADAIAAVRSSGDTVAVRGYCGAAVSVAVLIQPMVEASKLGVLYRHPDGTLICEERAAGTQEWGEVTTHVLQTLASDDTKDVKATQLRHGAQKLAALLTAAEPGVTAAYIEYAVATDDTVWFLQARPAPPPPDPAPWIDPITVDPRATKWRYVLDRDHNPDPLSAAQAGVVDGVADLVPTLSQRVVRGYLYYASIVPADAQPTPIALTETELERRFVEQIVPACDALLAPLEARLLSSDGALDERLLAEPHLTVAQVPLSAAWAAYRGVYARYVGELGPTLKRARGELDRLLRQSIGQPLFQHGALIAGIGGAQTLRLQALWELGRAGCPRPALRAHLARYGAYAPCWDVAVPCDDEQPERVGKTALSLSASESAPEQLHAQAKAAFQDALQKLVASSQGRLPEAELRSLVSLLRTALRIAEDDDALFFRAQRLLRWALLGRGAALAAIGRLPTASAIFDLPWTLHGDLPDDTFYPTCFAADQDLAALAAHGNAQRQKARALVPPTRLHDGQPLWTRPDGVLLTGYGVPVRGQPAGPVRGKARVVRSLDAPLGQQDVAGTILVLPALLPSWAHELWPARGLVTDSGGAFCHGAILARERGVPAVLGTQVATRSIVDGQELWLDAAAGRVLILPGPSPDALPRDRGGDPR